MLINKKQGIHLPVTLPVWKIFCDQCFVFLNNIHSVEKTNIPPSHQSAEVFPGVRQAVHTLGVPVVEEELVFVEQGEGFLHRADGGVDANLRLPDLKQ